MLVFGGRGVPYLLCNTPNKQNTTVVTFHLPTSKSRFTGSGTHSTTCMECAKAVQFCETTDLMPSAKPSMIRTGTRSMSPKSRKQMRPSRMYLRLPGEFVGLVFQAKWGLKLAKKVDFLQRRWNIYVLVE